MNVLLAVTGGIAAYKSAEIIRLLTKSGAEVQVVMTQAAQAFITPLTMQALSGRAVRTSLLDESAELGMGHIELARWADHIVIAPATADCIARISQGMANDLLSTVLLAYQGPVSVAPAMNQAMWSNPLTQGNISRLQQLFPLWSWLGPDSGDQACGDVGPGRMVEPQAVVASVMPPAKRLMTGKKILITAGPTIERLDPVRYLSNFSSGKMGYALAESAINAGAEVTIISGPVIVPAPSGAKIIQVESAQDMYQAVMSKAAEYDVFIATAAVADFRPENQVVQKIKKTGDNSLLSLKLVENPDIVASVANLQKDRPFVVGFAAETNQAVSYGKSKLSKKNLDMVVVNDVSIPGLGFGSDNNQVVLVTKKQEKDYGPAAKTTIADWLVEQISTEI